MGQTFQAHADVKSTWCHTLQNEIRGLACRVNDKSGLFMTLDKFSLSFKNKNHTVTSGFLPSKMRLKFCQFPSTTLLQWSYTTYMYHQMYHPRIQSRLNDGSPCTASQCFLSIYDISTEFSNQGIFINRKKTCKGNQSKIQRETVTDHAHYTSC